MTTVYSKDGLSFWPTKEENMQLTKLLPAGNYVIRNHPMRGLYFEQIPAFEMPRKLYGDTTRVASRIIRTFLDRPATTGVLLSGEKGSGKTLLAKRLAADCAALDIPCITVSQSFTGEAFNSLLQGVEQPCMLFFDEFEKVYSEDEAQQQLLTLMDGVFTSKKLFVLTVNDQYKVNQHMKNRPGRLFYALNYEGLTDEFIQEYCADNLNNSAQAEGVRQVASMFQRFNFDMLKAMIEEMNRYDETAQQVIKLLNTKPSDGESTTVYDMTVTRNGLPVTDMSFTPMEIQGNPLARNQMVFTAYPLTPAVKKGMDELLAEGGGSDAIDHYDVRQVIARAKAKTQRVTLLSTDLHSVDSATGASTYVKDGFEFKFTKRVYGRTGFDQLAYF
jgi:hypothetical protein